MNVYLVGFMGCGKSSVGQLLARQIGYEFLDLDGSIERMIGTTIAAYFSNHGEVAFRQHERKALEESTQKAKLVVATGGGTFCSPENQQIIHGSGGISVFVDAGWQIIEGRLAGSNKDRPKWQEREHARALFFERQRWYRQAMIRIEVKASSSPSDVVLKVVAALQGRACAT
ncbi:MAG: shikimate kinase [bacterium]|nr:shikimate kinase [bacterium]